jgi:hypothetical protein
MVWPDFPIQDNHGNEWRLLNNTLHSGPRGKRYAETVMQLVFHLKISNFFKALKAENCTAVDIVVTEMY